MLDGITIEVQIGSRLEVVRYIGLNIPVIQGAETTPEVYSEQSKRANERLVAGRAVILVLGALERDRDGRLLAFVYVADDVFVNATLIRQGYAEVVSYPPNVRYRADFMEEQIAAMLNGAGLWSDHQARKHYRPRACGVTASTRTKAYYHPDDTTLLLQPKETYVYFEDPEQAVTRGFEPALNYSTVFDRDFALRFAPEAYLGAGAYDRRLDHYLNRSTSSSLSLSGPTGSGTGSSVSGTVRHTPGTDVHVRGYTTSRGTYVAPYTRAAPGRGTGRR